MLTAHGNEWSITTAPDEQKHDFGRCAGVILRANIRKTIFAFFLFLLFLFYCSFLNRRRSVFGFACGTKTTSFYKHVFFKARLDNNSHDIIIIIMSKILAQLILAGSQVLGRAITRAIRQELDQAKQAASKRPQNVPPPLSTEMSLDEAMKILNVDELDPERIEKNYKHLFEMNSKQKGGSFYIQSKVYRAKERLDQELKHR